MRRAVTGLTIACFLASCAAMHEVPDGGARDAGVRDASMGAPDSGEMEAAVRAFIEAFEDARCEATIRCEGATFLGGLLEALYCHPRLPLDYPTGSFALTRDDPQRALDGWLSGDLPFDPDAAARCLARQSRVCHPLGLFDSCSDVFGYCDPCDGGRCDLAGGGLGEPCPCTEGLVCTSGTCTAGEPMGGACDADRRCGAYGRCVGGVCVRIVLPSEPCDAGMVCPRPFYCDGGACQPLPLLAERCERPARCAHGVCMEGTCAPIRTDCDFLDDETAFGPCEHGWCNLFGSCPRRADLGEPCESLWGPLCAGDLICSTDGCVSLHLGPDC